MRSRAAPSLVRSRSPLLARRAVAPPRGRGARHGRRHARPRARPARQHRPRALRRRPPRRREHAPARLPRQRAPRHRRLSVDDPRRRRPEPDRPRAGRAARRHPHRGAARRAPARRRARSASRACATSATRRRADETLAIWGHERGARRRRVGDPHASSPTSIITRFDEQPPNHGHHTASAILAREAFAAAADPTRFPGAARARRRAVAGRRGCCSTCRPGARSRRRRTRCALDVGGYDPRLGLGYGELAARSRSQHKSQGFGVAGRARRDRRALRAARRHAGRERDILDGVDLGWSALRRRAARRVDAALDEARARARARSPGARAAGAARARTRALDGAARRRRACAMRARALDEIIAAAAGLFVRATAARAGAPCRAATVPVRVEIVLRRPAAMTLAPRRVSRRCRRSQSTRRSRVEREDARSRATCRSRADAPVSAPYWLAAAAAGRAVRSSRDPRLVGEPKGPPPLAVDGRARARRARRSGSTVPVVYAWTDPRARRAHARPS